MSSIKEIAPLARTPEALQQQVYGKDLILHPYKYIRGLCIPSSTAVEDKCMVHSTRSVNNIKELHNSLFPTPFRWTFNIWGIEVEIILDASLNKVAPRRMVNAKVNINSLDLNVADLNQYMIIYLCFDPVDKTEQQSFLFVPFATRRIFENLQTGAACGPLFSSAAVDIAIPDRVSCMVLKSQPLEETQQMNKNYLHLGERLLSMSDFRGPLNPLLLPSVPSDSEYSGLVKQMIKSTAHEGKNLKLIGKTFDGERKIMTMPLREATMKCKKVEEQIRKTVPGNLFTWSQWTDTNPLTVEVDAKITRRAVQTLSDMCHFGRISQSQMFIPHNMINTAVLARELQYDELQSAASQLGAYGLVLQPCFDGTRFLKDCEQLLCESAHLTKLINASRHDEDDCPFFTVWFYGELLLITCIAFIQIQWDYRKGDLNINRDRMSPIVLHIIDDLIKSLQEEMAYGSCEIP